MKHNSVLELRDCEIKSLNFIKEIGSETHTVNDAAFLLKHPKTTEIHEDGPNLSLILKNCIVSKFCTAVESIFLSTICVEKSYFADCLSHALNVSNPYYFTVRDSTIENSGKSCVNIRFSKEIDCIFQRKVVVENCELNRSSGYGISIFGENMAHQACKLYIRNNRINKSKKDGLGVKNLNIQEILIAENHISESQGNGLFLQNVIDYQCLSRVESKANNIEKSHMYGLAVLDTCIFSEEDQLVRNEKGGVIISGGEAISKTKEYEFYKSHPLRCLFNLCKIHDNKDSGIIIVGCLKGPVVLNSCDIHNNSNGIYCRMKMLPQVNRRPVEDQERPLSPKFESNLPTPRGASLGHVVVENCNIFQNRENGLNLKCLCEKIFLKSTFLQENKSYAVYLDNAEDKENLILDKIKMKQQINGFIGGDWGLLHDEQEGVCKANKCRIF